MEPREIPIPKLKTRITTPPSRDDALEKQRALSEYEALVEKEAVLDSILKAGEQARRDFEQKIERIEGKNENITAQNEATSRRRTRIYLLSGLFLAIAGVCFLLKTTVMAGW